MTAGEGHNSTITGSAQEEVRSYVRRALNLESDKADIQADLTELYREAKDRGFDPKILRKVVARARKDPQELATEEALIATYEAAIQGDLFADDTKVSISVVGKDGTKKTIVETTAKKMQAAADAVR